MSGRGFIFLSLGGGGCSGPTPAPVPALGSGLGLGLGGALKLLGNTGARLVLFGRVVLFPAKVTLRLVSRAHRYI